MAVRYTTRIHYINPDNEASIEERSFEGLDADAVTIAGDAADCAAEALSEGSYVPTGSIVVTVNISNEHFPGQ